MIMAEIILAGLVLTLVTGGSVRHLAKEPLKGGAILLLLLPVQLLWPSISRSLSIDCQVGVIVWLLMMAVLAIVLMWNAPARWMLAIAALGIASNVFVIGMNQAMPVSIEAASEIGGSRVAVRDALASDCLYEEADADTRMALLADIIAIPGPGWQRGVVSVGDLIMSVGLAAWVFVASRDCRGSAKQSMS